PYTADTRALRGSISIQRRSRSPFVGSGFFSLPFLLDSVGRKRRIGTEKRRRVTSEGLVELKKRTVSGIWIRQEYGIRQTLTEPIRIADGNHFVVNTVDYKSGLVNSLQYREALSRNPVPLAERGHLRLCYVGA